MLNSLRRSVVAPHIIFMLLICGCLSAIQGALAQEISGRVQRHLDQAQDCRVNDDFDCARAALDKIPRKDLSIAEQYRYWIALGYVQFLDGNFPEAIDAYENAAKYSPTPETRQYHLRSVAQLQASMGQFQNAYETLEELLVLNGDIPLTGRHLSDDGLWRGLDIYLIGDRDLFALGENQLEYPGEAAAQGLLQGFVDLELTVTRTGLTSDIRVIASSAPVFEKPAVEAAERFRYKPRVVNGKPVETVVRRRVEFESSEGPN